MSRVVGDDDCSFQDILACLTKSKGAKVFVDSWKDFARELGTDEMTIAELERDVVVRGKRTKDVILDILYDWKSRLASSATLNALLDVLEVKCGWKDIAANLWRDFPPKILETTKWTDLDARTKSMLEAKQIEFFGRKTCLKEILEPMQPKDRKRLHQKTLCGPILRMLLDNKHLSLTVDTIPEVPAYYIPRTIASKRIINKEIFQKQQPDIFVVDKINPSKFSQIAGRQRIQKSSKQTKKVTTRFILLEFSEDFDKICKVAEDIPVHLFHYKDDKIYWVKTHGSLHLVQTHLETDEEHHSEEEFLEMMTSSDEDKVPFCFSDAPGMGKSFSLANAAGHFKENSADRYTIFVSFPELLREMRRCGKTVAMEDLKCCIADFSSKNLLGKEIITKFLGNEKTKFELFLDGFDEVNNVDLEMAKNILKCLRKEFNNVRVHAATRPHKRHQLESALGVLAFNLVPFTVQNQITFMQKFWLHNCEIQTTPTLEQYAEGLISMVRSKVPLKECEISGIPLQCAILAELCKEDASKHSKVSSFVFGVALEVSSIHDMYNALIRKRFERVDTQIREQIRNVHIYHAVDLLMPMYAEDIKRLLKVEGPNNSSEEEVNAVGLMAFSIKDMERKGTKYTFLHRTYAEFLLAVFLVDFKTNPRNSLNDYLWTTLSKMFFEEVLNLSPESGEELFISQDGALDLTAVWKTLLASCHGNEHLLKQWHPLAKALKLNNNDIDEIRRKHADTNTNDVKPNLDPWFLVLHFWTGLGRVPQTMTDLIEALNSIHFDTAIENLKSKYYKEVFHHDTLCFFVDVGLLKPERSEEGIYLCLLVTKFLGTSCSFALSYSKVLETCCYRDFSGIFRFVAQCLLLRKEHVNCNIDFPNLLLLATLHSSLELVDYCCNLLEFFEDKNLNQIKFPFSLFETDCFEHTPLHVAASRGDFFIFEYFFKRFDASRIKQMKYLLHTCTDKSSLLTKQVISDKLEIISLLLDSSRQFLEEEEEPSLFGKSGRETPIVMSQVHFSLTKYLLLNGANARRIDELSGCNLVHYAATHYSPEEFHDVVVLLLERGFEDVFKMKEKSWSRTPIHDACRGLDLKAETIRLFSSRLNVTFNNPDSERCTEFFLAVEGGRKRETLELMVDCGADISRVHENNQTVLYAAASMAHLETIEYLVSLGCDVNARDNDGYTPMHFSVIDGEKDTENVVRLLLKLGAIAKIKDKKQKTALWYARTSAARWRVTQATIDMLKAAEDGTWV